MSEELLPCPFCGGEARIIEAEIGMFEDGYAVYCGGTCGVKMGVYGRLGEAYKWTPSFSTEDEAIEAWNTRAERTCHRMPADDGAVMVMRGGLAMEFPYFECSECGAYVMDNARYCPNCGAKVVSE